MIVVMCDHNARSTRRGREEVGSVRIVECGDRIAIFQRTGALDELALQLSPLPAQGLVLTSNLRISQLCLD